MRCRIDYAAFAAGDFNTTRLEDEQERLLDRFARPDWTLAHDVGCGGCQGTHYYGRGESWSFLDMILLAKPRGEKQQHGFALNPCRLPTGTPPRCPALARQSAIVPPTGPASPTIGR